MVKNPPHFNELTFPFLPFLTLGIAFVILLFSFTPFMKNKVEFKKFPPRSEYVCPDSPWVDCMPSPDSPPQPQCQPDYLQWAYQNCPGFQGAAL